MRYLIIVLIFTSLIICCSKKHPEKNPQTEIEESSPQATNEIVEKKKEVQDLFKKIKKIDTPDFTRGIYLTAYTVASEKFEPLLDLAEQAGINTVVFDIKNMKGDVFLSGLQKDSVRAEKFKPIIDIGATVKTLHKRNMKAVARIVIFHDQLLAENFPDLRPQRISGGVWQESKRGKPSWLDSSNPEVQEEVLGIIERAASYGVDEIQMDYIRFPTQGDLDDAEFYFQQVDREISLQDTNYTPRSKVDIIEKFINITKKKIEKYGVTLTADIFAIVAWQSEVDVRNTGQDISRLSRYLNAVHPMIYSSHFSENFGYRENVYNEPYYLVYEGTRRTKERTASGCSIIPYIQSNSWKVNYKKEYVIAQIRALEDAGAEGFILWSSSNRYTNTLMWISDYYNK
jgi:hypothetical protein